jgi:hypothetical protein
MKLFALVLGLFTGLCAACAGETDSTEVLRTQGAIETDASVPSSTVRGLLVYADGKGGEVPARNIRVTLNHPTLGRSASAYSSFNDGMYYVPNVPPGAYRLEVWIEPEKPIVYEIHVQPTAYTDIAPIRLP